MELKDRIARDSLPLTAVALVGRAVGMMVPLVIARWFGADRDSDAFYLALAAPMFVEALLASSLHATLGPLYAAAQGRGADTPARFLGGAIVGVGLATSALAFALALALPALLPRVAVNNEEVALTAIRLLPLLLAALPFLGVNIAAAGALELSGHFLVPAWLPAVRGATYLVVAGALRSRLGVFALPVGYLAAEITQSLWLIWGMRRKQVGLRLNLPRFGPVWAAFGIFVPVALGDLAVHVNAFVDRLMAARLGAGDLTALEYADRVRVIPEALVGAGLLRVTFAHWSHQHSRQNPEAIRRSFDAVARWLVILLLPATVGLWLVRRPLVAGLFQGQAFDAAAVDRTTHTLMGYIPGIPGLMLGSLAIQVLWVQGRVRALAVVGLVSAACNLLLNLAFYRELGVFGLALSTSLTQTLVAGILFALATKHLGTIVRAGFWSWAAGVTALNLGLGWGLGAVLGPLPADPIAGLAPSLGVAAGLGLLMAGIVKAGGDWPRLKAETRGPEGPS